VSQAGFDGDFERRILSCGEETLRPMPRRTQVPHRSCWSAVYGWSLSRVARSRAVARDLGIHSEALRKRVRQAEIDAGARGGVRSEEHEEIGRLRRENYELAACE